MPVLSSGHKNTVRRKTQWTGLQQVILERLSDHGHVRAVLQGQPMPVRLVHVALHVLRGMVRGHEDNLQAGLDRHIL